MKRDKLTREISPCCTLNYSQMVFLINNAVFNNESDRAVVLSSLDQRGRLTRTEWIFFACAVAYNPDSTINCQTVKDWLVCKQRPNCEQLKLFIESIDLGNWNPPLFFPNPAISNDLDPERVIVTGDTISNILDQYTKEYITATETTDLNVVDNIIYFTFNGKKYKRNHSYFISVLWFGAIGNKNTDSTIFFENAIEFCRTEKKDLFVPSGNYKLIRPLNISIEKFKFFGEENTNLFFYGTHDFCISIDAGSTSVMYGMTLKDVNIWGNPDIKDGIYTRAFVHKIVNNVRIFDVNRFGINIEFDVASVYDNVFVSINEYPSGETPLVNPISGLRLFRRDVGERVESCQFNNCCIEGVVGYGVDIEDGNSNNFIKLISEGNGSGLLIHQSCIKNSFFDIYCEANSIVDIDIYGSHNSFNHAELHSLINKNGILRAGSDGNYFNSSYIRICYIEENVIKPSFTNCQFYLLTSLSTYASFNSRLVTGTDTSQMLPNVLENTTEFTPKLEGGTFSGVNVYTKNRGTSRRIGSLVFIDIELELSAKDPAMNGVVVLSGLPTQAKVGNRIPFNIYYHHITFSGAQFSELIPIINPGGVSILFQQVGSNASTEYLQSAGIANTTRMWISGFYIAE